MTEQAVVNGNLWKFADLSVLRVSDTVIFRKGNDYAVQMKQAVVDNSLMPKLSNAEEWHTIGKVDFGVGDSIRLDASDDGFLFVVHWANDKTTPMDGETATNLLNFLVGDFVVNTENE